MPNSIDFKKVLDNSLYTYMPQKLSELEEVVPNVNNRIPENVGNRKPPMLGLVYRLRPVVEYTASSEIIVGSVLMILLLLYAGDYDKLFATEDSKQISLMTFGGSFFLVLNGIILIMSLKMNNRKYMGNPRRYPQEICKSKISGEMTWPELVGSCAQTKNIPLHRQTAYILTSTILWFYLFVMSVMKIHFALLVIQKDTDNAVLPERYFFLSNACSFGVATMLGSVTHFIGNVAVVTYYNLKYVQPKLVSCGP